MARIVEATDSLVTPNDFYQMPPGHLADEASDTGAAA
jgi:hypothetical protein